MRKIVRYGVCGLAALMLLAGCTKKPEETTAAETTAAETTAGTETAETGADEIDPGKVTLGEYKGLEIEGMSTEVTDEEVEIQINRLLAQNPTYVEITDRPAQLGDIVNIDYVGMKDGVAFQGGTADGHDLELGSQSFIDGFEEGIVGASKGDELSLNLKFPEQYHSADLAGQEVVFDVTVNSIEEKKESVLDEAFVQSMTDFTTVEEFRVDVRAEMISQNEANAEYMKETQALKAAIDNATFECNPEAIEVEYQSRRSMYDSMAAGYGMATADYIAAMGGDAESFEAELRDLAEQVIKQKLIVDAIAKAEKLEADDISRQKVADGEGMDVQTLVESYGQEAVDDVALTYKVVGFLAENAVVK